MFDWFQSLAAALTQLLVEGNLLVYVALFAVSAVIEFGVPVPFVQDTVLLYIGFGETTQLWRVAPPVVLCLMAGRLAGASAVFWLARRHGPRLIARLKTRFPSMVARAEALGERLCRRCVLAVAIARLTPGLLTPSTIAAGLFRVKYPHFCGGVAISSLVPDLGEIVSGLAIRAGITFLGVRPSPSLFVIVLLAFMALAWLARWLIERRVHTLPK